MSVREKGIISRRIAQSYLSSVISISLVLFLVGGAAMVISNAKSVSDYFRENMKISAELSLSADETSALSLAKKIEGMDGIKSVEYISREQGIREMEEQLGSGFLDVFETPPIPISLEISLDAAYVEADSLKIIEERITDIPGVDGLYYQQSLFDSLNDNIEKAGAVLAFIRADREYGASELVFQEIHHICHAARWGNQRVYQEAFHDTGLLSGAHCRNGGRARHNSRPDRGEKRFLGHSGSHRSRSCHGVAGLCGRAGHFYLHGIHGGGHK